MFAVGRKRAEWQPPFIAQLAIQRRHFLASANDGGARGCFYAKQKSEWTRGTKRRDEMNIKILASSGFCRQDASSSSIWHGLPTTRCRADSYEMFDKLANMARRADGERARVENLDAYRHFLSDCIRGAQIAVAAGCRRLACNDTRRRSPVRSAEKHLAVRRAPRAPAKANERVFSLI